MSQMSALPEITDRIRLLVDSNLDNNAISEVEELLTQVRIVQVIGDNIVPRSNKIDNALIPIIEVLVFTSDNGYIVLNLPTNQLQYIGNVELVPVIIYGVATSGYPISQRVYNNLNWLPAPVASISKELIPIIYNATDNSYAVINILTPSSSGVVGESLMKGIATWVDYINYYGVKTSGWIFNKQDINRVIDIIELRQ